VHLRRSYKENGSTYTKSYYDKLLEVLSTDALKYGDWQKLTPEGD